MIKMRAARVLIRMVISASVILGCATACGESATPAPKPAATPVLASSAQLNLPVAAYELTDTQNAEVEYLNELYTQRCMRSFGFDYLPGLSVSSIADNVRISKELNSRRYGVSDPAAAATYGYNMPTWTRGTSAPVTIASLPHTEITVLTGQRTGDYRRRPIPQGGCLTQASRDLSAAGIDANAQGEGASADAPLTQKIGSQDFLRAQSDPRVLAVNARWAACMRSYGDSGYTTPLKTAMLWNLNIPASTSEIQTAMHDVACKQKVNVVGVEFAVESDYENADIVRNARTLAQAKAEIATDAAGIRRLMASVRSA
jgi:hypothetical protein